MGQVNLTVMAAGTHSIPVVVPEAKVEMFKKFKPLATAPKSVLLV